jgi:branched-subunit amino acid transport protein
MVTIIFIIIGTGVVTFLLRLSFIQLTGQIDLLLRFQEALRLVPAVVFPALVVPALLFRDGVLDLSLGNGRLIAGMVAVTVARLTKSLPLTVTIGMTTLWILQAIAARGG